MTASFAFGEVQWPIAPSPEPTVSVAKQTVLNGMPMRISVFTSQKSVDEIAGFYRREWGAKRVENKLGNSTVIGHGEGEFYTTVQMTPSPDGVKCVIATSHLAKSGGEAQRADFRPPVESRLLSDMESLDGSKSSRHTAYANRQSIDLNRERLIQFLGEKGLSLEQQGNETRGNGTALFFRGGGKEAIAVISRSGDETFVVLNVVRSLEEAK